ncbi:hypothetical protein HDU76_009610, partial [Blyttiomyces sp. JEL0837]
MNGTAASNLPRYKNLTETTSLLDISLITPNYIEALTFNILADATELPKPEDFATPEGHANWQGGSVQQKLSTLINLTFLEIWHQDSDDNTVSTARDVIPTSSNIPSVIPMFAQPNSEQSANLVEDSIDDTQQPLSVHLIERQLHTSTIDLRSCYRMILTACARADAANNTTSTNNIALSPASVTILKFYSPKWGISESTQVIQYVNLVFTVVHVHPKIRLHALRMLEDGLGSVGVDWISNDE